MSLLCKDCRFGHYFTQSSYRCFNLSTIEYNFIRPDPYGFFGADTDMKEIGKVDNQYKEQ